MQDTLILVAAVVSIPLVLLLIRALFAWRYRRTLEMATRAAAGAARESDGPVSPAARPARPLTVKVGPVASDTPRTEAARALAREARAVTRRMRVAFAVAILVYDVIVSAVLFAGFRADLPADGKLLGAYLLQATILFIVAVVLALPARRVVWLAAGYLAIGVALLAAMATPSRALLLVRAEAELFAILPGLGLALLSSRLLRPVLIGLVALLLYLALSIAIAIALVELQLVPDVRDARPIAWVLGIVNFLLGVVVFGWLLGRSSLRGPVAGLVCAAILGAVLAFTWNPDFPAAAIAGLLMSIPLTVLQLSLVWLTFRASVRLQDLHILSPQALQSHVAVGFLSTYLLLLLQTALFEQRAGHFISMAAAFGAYVLVLHLLLRRIWRERRAREGTRLLFLRVFGSSKGPERLLDALEDTWRRVGRTDLIGAGDLALRTIGSRMLQAFFLRRAEKEFVRTAADVAPALQQLRASVETDGRYPVNELYCTDATWQRVVRHLIAGTDVVLMDMRGFTDRNRGVVFELAELIAHVPLGRIVVVADRSTDLPALEGAASAAWANLPVGSPNLADVHPELNVLDFVGSHERCAKSLFVRLLEAAGPSAGESVRVAPLGP